jgi:hypothetical protein
MMVWKFENKTTGAAIECNDLNFLLHELIEIRGMTIPNSVGVDLMLSGTASFEVQTDRGMQEVALEKLSLLRGHVMTMASPVFI